MCGSYMFDLHLRYAVAASAGTHTVHLQGSATGYIYAILLCVLPAGRWLLAALSLSESAGRRYNVCSRLRSLHFAFSEFVFDYFHMKNRDDCGCDTHITVCLSHTNKLNTCDVLYRVSRVGELDIVAIAIDKRYL